MRVSYIFGILRLFPIFQILQEFQEGFVTEVVLVCQVMEVSRASERLDEFELKLEPVLWEVG